MTATKVTPMMAQWHSCKQQAKDAVLIFRMGDFYELFYDDAELAAREIDLTLTKRQGIPMAGVPCHSAEGYIDRLVAKGYRVAIAEQMEDPKQAKGLVKREIIRTVTPGTVVNSSLLPEKSNNFFAAICSTGKEYGLAFLDLTTSDFRVIEFETERDLANELHRIRPSELLCPRKFQEKHCKALTELKQSLQFALNIEDDWHFDYQITYPCLTQHFKVHSLDGFGMKGMVAGVNAAGSLLTYIQDNLKLSASHIRQLSTYTTADFMTLDRITLRNLELTESLQDGSRKHTLLEHLDRTRTPMGGRLMRHWIKQPLLKVDAVRERQDAVEQLVNHGHVGASLAELLDRVRDLERLMMKTHSGYANPRDLLSLAQSLLPLPKIKTLLYPLSSKLLTKEEALLGDFSELVRLITEALADEPPIKVSDGKVFRQGYNRELDELRSINSDAKTWLATYQAKLKEQYGIKTLRVGFNRVFGYYIEVSKGQAHLMPDSFQRRQTLVNNERFISPELKEYEGKVLTAQDRIGALELELFQQLREKVCSYFDAVMATAGSLARVDCINGLAEIAVEYHYERPLVDDSQTLCIREGRHPVIEASNFSEAFVPNDTELDQSDQRLLVITGPNMAGKSTYIRQVALLCIMAQMGSFIPAAEARIGVVDKVFTRIGASDDLSRGQSTFMVEMTETANILNNVTDRSLVVLDEIGRGTSTYDGISIAWAVAEYLLTTSGKQAKTLFATHYWELTRLETTIPGAVNYNVAVQECEDDIIFLRKIVKGGTDRSYGIHVARLAGLPQAMIERAHQILEHLEENATGKDNFDNPTSKQMLAMKVGKSEQDLQLLLFEPQKKCQNSKRLEKLKRAVEDADPDHISPIQAHQLLYQLREML